jgi:hypothetical protein
MGSEENLDFDLTAASLRADESELDTSVEVLAGSLEQALPHIASVERHKVGGFRSKQREVRRISVEFGEEHFELIRDGHGLRCTRNKIVRGIALSHDELPLTAWVSALVEGVVHRAEISEQGRIALEGLLR